MSRRLWQVEYIRLSPLFVAGSSEWSNAALDGVCGVGGVGGRCDREMGK